MFPVSQTTKERTKRQCVAQQIPWHANEASHIWQPLTKWKSTGRNGVQLEAPVCELDFSCSCGRLGEQRTPDENPF